MPEITTDNDKYVYKVHVKNKSIIVCIDGMELSGKMLEAGFSEVKDTDIKQIVGMIREIAWGEPEGSMGGVTDSELLAVGLKVINHMDALGKEPGPPPSSLPSTASGPSAAA